MPNSLASLLLPVRCIASGLCAFLIIAAMILPVRAQDAPLAREDVEQIIRDYLLNNPEIIRDAIQELERRQTAEAEERRKRAVADNRAALFEDPDDIVIGNPDGDVTLVEFFDYNCGFCRRALADLQDLVAQDPNLRVVIKEWPFLSTESLEAARVSLAVANQGRYMDFHSALLGGRGQADGERALATAEALGYDMDQLRADMESTAVMARIQQTAALAEAIGVTGTPAYVVGNEVLLGVQGFATLKQRIDDLRADTCATC